MAFTLEQENALLNLLNEKRTTLSELPAVAGINEDDLFLIRQGISDKSVTAAVIRKTLSPQASLANSGGVQLTNSTDGDRQDVATTPKAVNAAIRKPATLTSAGTVKLTNSIDADNQQDAVTPKGVYDALKDASLHQKGIVQLSNAIDSDSESLAASSAAVKAVADKLPKMVILYPNGTEAAPYTITGLTRLEIDSPFPGRQIMCLPEILVNTIWAGQNWIYQEPSSFGIGAFPINNGEKIVIQAGNYTSAMFTNSGAPHKRTTNSSSDKIRLKVWTID